jgi:hypothetical protein
VSTAWRPPPADTVGPEGGDGPPPGRTVLVLLVALVLVVGGAVLLAPRISAALNGEDGVARDGDVREDTGLELDSLRTFPDLPGDVVTTEVRYPQIPPAGGAHWRQWPACGSYDVPVRSENAVAALARGAVWMVYRPSLSESDVAKLTSLLPDGGILSPYPDLPVPATVTVWGVQLNLTGGDDRRLPEFLRVYGDGHTAPGTGGCDGGTAAPAGDPS